MKVLLLSLFFISAAQATEFICKSESTSLYEYFMQRGFDVTDSNGQSFSVILSKNECEKKSITGSDIYFCEYTKQKTRIAINTDAHGPNGTVVDTQNEEVLKEELICEESE